MTFSIIQKSQLEGAMRLDAEYYQPEYLGLENNLKKTASDKTWGEINGKFITGPFGSEFHVENYELNGKYRYVRGKDVKDFFLMDNDNVYIPEKDFNRLKKYALNKNDILISVVGTLGNASIIDQSEIPAIFSCKSTVFRTDEINPFYFITYLNSKYGKGLLERSVRGAVQTGLNIDDLKSLLVYVPEKKVQEQISKMVMDGKDEIRKSKELYQQAEDLLLEKLGLKDFEEEKSLFSVVNLSEVENAERMDAEYFQGEYKKIIDKVEKYKGGWDYLENFTEFINNGNQPAYSENGEIKFFSQKWIKDKEIDYSFLTDENEPRVSKSFFEDKKNASYLIKKYDILYYSVGANLGYCHNYLEDENIAIGSFINLIRADDKKINPICLGFVLNSIVGRMQAEMNKSGLAQPYIYAKNLRKFKIPILPKETQQKIAELVKKSHTSRKKAKELLEEAKRKVEEMIEKGGGENGKK